jgi:hypothetical protein
MIKPLPIVLCVFIAVFIVGCGSRNSGERNDIENEGQEKAMRVKGVEAQAGQFRVIGAPHALTTPVAALGIRG